MTTPAKPRPSAIPTPGRVSGLPTPGTRSRSSSNVYQTRHALPDNNDISRALAEAIKANDPSQHRTLPLSASSSASSLSPPSLSNSISNGRRSVVGRPSSSASISSVKAPERAKTPTLTRPTSRPPSRQSDAAVRTRTFEVGDNVRIESLGFEGTLRYIGEIDGKPGLWAGVELGGGFAGKGKNNGSVAGNQYFSCPEKCGVFVATTKLSLPTVGPGAIQRPSSVASSRGGRTTPAMTGRVTPSHSVTRTPSASFSNGRITPSAAAGRTTPGTGITTRKTFKTPTPKPANGTSLTDKITAGSRAAKYMNMTAKQLCSRDLNNGAESPTRKSSAGLAALPSPTLSRTLSSPSRPSGSPFSTPKAGGGRLPCLGPTVSPSLPSIRSRPSINTPRPRIPSAVAMPPPPSPILPQQSPETVTMDYSLPSTESRNKNHLRSYSRPSSSTSFRSSGTEEVSLVEQLQSRLDALEYENERLRASLAAERPERPPDPAQLEQLQSEKQKAIERTVDLESKLTSLEQGIKARDDRLQNLEARNLELTTQLNGVKDEVQRSVATKEQEAEYHRSALKILQDQVQELQRLGVQKDDTVKSFESDNDTLRNDLERAHLELEEERRELGAQIDELRIAGQETIALYEERLSNSKSEQYELEHRIGTLESRLRAAANDASAQEQAPQRITSSAAQIDNETLRDQVQHLQRKSAKLEEQLEDARAALERDVTTYQERIGRIRMDEEQRKRDLLAKSKEVEQLLKSEARARGRVEEIEEALRESTVALENTRGEVESLRAELSNLDVLIDDTTEGDISFRLASFVKRVASERSRLQQEIRHLEEALKEFHGGKHQESLNALKAENKELKDQVLNFQGRSSDLMHTLDDQSNEMETLRKKVNREASLSNGILDYKSISPKSETSNREEVAGLKHIVQELQKENLSATQRIKLLESENQLLASEAAQLREEVQILEDNVDNSLLECDKLPETISSTNVNDIDGLRRQLKEQNMRYEECLTQNELDQMRKKLSETDMKNARAVHDLNKEISELEALVESKIYREDELEQEVERLKDKLARQKKSSKNGVDTIDSRNRPSPSTYAGQADASKIEVCEICERPGHDIFNCNLLKEDVQVPTGARNGKEPYCEDCESPGHTAVDCPHSLDVF